MSKSIELKDNFLISSKSVAVDRESLYDFLFFKPGDRYTFNFYLSTNRITSSSTNITLTIIFPKLLRNIKSITVNSLTNVVFRSIGGYYYPNSGTGTEYNFYLKDFDRVYFDFIEDNRALLTFKVNDKFYYKNKVADNNVPVAIDITELTVTFN